jgi:hypothetical protein
MFIYQRVTNWDFYQALTNLLCRQTMASREISELNGGFIPVLNGGFDGKSGSFIGKMHEWHIGPGFSHDFSGFQWWI